MKLINGNWHSDVARVTFFGHFKTVVEPVSDDCIKITVYVGNEQRPIARELYGSD